MSTERDIPRAEVERVRDELSYQKSRLGFTASCRYGIGIGVRKLAALLTEHGGKKKGGDQ